MMKEQKAFTINSRKFDKSIHRSWKAELLERNSAFLKFAGVFDDEIIHPHLGVIRRGTVSYEYYWLDRWYNIFEFHEPEGDLRNFYCNINLPPRFENGVLDYIDLDIDVLVWKDFSYKILDLDDFKENSVKFSYSDEIIEKAFLNVEKLKLKIENRKFPFDFETEL